MTKEQLIQILSDFSYQYGDTYEQRCVFDNDFDELVDVILSKYQRVIILTDDSGHDYIVPAELSEEFSRLLDLGEVAEDEFIDKFEKYMCGGDPFGEYKFYIKTDEKI